MKFSSDKRSNLILLNCFGLFWCTVSASEVSGDNGDFDNAFFIYEIFEKYGNNNSITYEGFEHLLQNLGLGKLKFETNHDVSIHKVNGTFVEFHDKLSLHKHNHSFSKMYKTTLTERKRRNPKEGGRVVEKLDKRKCLTPQDILITFGLQPHHDVVISPSKYLQICPAMIYELDQKLCGIEVEESTSGLSPLPKDYHLVWIYASVSVLLMGVSGILCILMVPIIKKNYHSSLIQFLVSLAVGTLCGDALIHLLPQVYSKHGQSGFDSTPVFKGTTTLSAILLFFVIENLLKEIKSQKTKRVKRVKELDNMLPVIEVENRIPGHNHEADEIKSLAWMAILGDVLHNLTDGLSIGAAFTSSLSAGFASSIAIFCHELPHELGDYAILLASGMSAKKSLFYNFLSTMFSFVGMAAGILLGEFQDASLWINSFTAGSFLYIALSDLVPEMKIMSSNSHFKSLLVQLFGVCCGGSLMLGIALYEDKIEDILN